MNFMRNHTTLLALLPIAAILTIQPAFAADIDEKAQTVLESFSKLIEGVDSLKVNVSVATTIEIQDKSNEINAKHTFAFQRPNLFALRIQEGALGGATVNDGQHLYTYVPGLRSYTESDAPGSYAEFLERGEFGMLRMAAGNTPVLDAMMYASPFDAIRDGVETMTYLGTEDVGGVSCHVVEIAGKGPTWKCWIDAGEKPWILKAASGYDGISAEYGPASRIDRRRKDGIHRPLHELGSQSRAARQRLCIHAPRWRPQSQFV